MFCLVCVARSVKGVYDGRGVGVTAPISDAFNAEYQDVGRH